VGGVVCIIGVDGEVGMYLLYRAVGSGRLDVDVEASIDPSGRESGVVCAGSRVKLADE
jgi:hypothetical protein